MGPTRNPVAVILQKPQTKRSSKLNPETKIDGDVMREKLSYSADHRFAMSRSSPPPGCSKDPTNTEVTDAIQAARYDICILYTQDGVLSKIYHLWNFTIDQLGMIPRLIWNSAKLKGLDEWCINFNTKNSVRWNKAKKCSISSY